MDLMATDELRDLLEQDGGIVGEKESDIIMGLERCHQIQDLEEQYRGLVTLAGLVRGYMALPENNEKRWPAILLRNMQDYVVSEMKEHQEAVPRELHFVWIGSRIPDVVMTYIRVWAKLNPDYHINIWYDSNLVKLKVLSDILKAEAERTHPREKDNMEWADKVFQLRQIFTAYVLQNSLLFQDMSPVMQEFLGDRGAEIDLEDATVWDGELPFPNMQLRDMQAEGIFTEGMYADELYTVYMLEAIQTQNFAALSDMARLLVLRRYGGVYLDTDMLPEIMPELIEAFCIADEKMQRPLLQAIMEATGEISSYPVSQLENCGKTAEMRDAVAGKSIEELMVPLGEMSCSPMAFRVFYNGNIINQMVISHPGSMMINELLHQIVQNYNTMGEYFEKPPLIGQGYSLYEVTDRRIDAVKKVRDTRVYAMLARCCAYYETGLLKEIRCTVDLTGPGVYASAIADVSELESGICSRYDKGIDFDRQGYYIIPRRKLSVYTEEELRSSWVASE